MASRDTEIERIRSALRKAADSSGLTLEAIGIEMGYSIGGARQAVSRLLNGGKGHDPRLSTLIAFSKAIKIPLKNMF